jgi:hypothetical protein
VPPGLKKTPCSVFTLAVTSASAGRQWSATEPECFGRSFSELNFTKGDGATQRQQTDTTEWVRPALDLAKVAPAWEPQAGHDGVSRLGEDHERQQRPRRCCGPHCYRTPCETVMSRSIQPGRARP